MLQVVTATPRPCAHGRVPAGTGQRRERPNPTRARVTLIGVVGFGVDRSGFAVGAAIGGIFGAYGQARIEAESTDGLVPVCRVRAARTGTRSPRRAGERVGRGGRWRPTRMRNAARGCRWPTRAHPEPTQSTDLDQRSASLEWLLTGVGISDHELPCHAVQLRGQAFASRGGLHYPLHFPQGWPRSATPRLPPTART
jgi:hypothetical protein